MGAVSVQRKPCKISLSFCTAAVLNSRFFHYVQDRHTSKLSLVARRVSDKEHFNHAPCRRSLADHIR